MYSNTDITLQPALPETNAAACVQQSGMESVPSEHDSNTWKKRPPGKYAKKKEKLEPEAKLSFAEQQELQRFQNLENELLMLCPIVCYPALNFHGKAQDEILGWLKGRYNGGWATNLDNIINARFDGIVKFKVKGKEVIVKGFQTKVEIHLSNVKLVSFQHSVLLIALCFYVMTEHKTSLSDLYNLPKTSSFKTYVNNYDVIFVSNKGARVFNSSKGEIVDIPKSEIFKRLEQYKLDIRPTKQISERINVNTPVVQVINPRKIETENKLLESQPVEITTKAVSNIPEGTIIPIMSQTKQERNKGGFLFRKGAINNPTPLKTDKSHKENRDIRHVEKVNRENFLRQQIKEIQTSIKEVTFSMDNFPALKGELTQQLDMLAAKESLADHLKSLAIYKDQLYKSTNTKGKADRDIIIQNIHFAWAKRDKRLKLTDFKKYIDLNVLEYKLVDKKIQLSGVNFDSKTWLPPEASLLNFVPIHINRTQKEIKDKVYSTDKEIELAQRQFDHILLSLKHLPYPIKMFLFDKVFPCRYRYKYDAVKDYRKKLDRKNAEKCEWLFLLKDANDKKFLENLMDLMVNEAHENYLILTNQAYLAKYKVNYFLSGPQAKKIFLLDKENKLLSKLDPSVYEENLFVLNSQALVREFNWVNGLFEEYVHGSQNAGSPIIAVNYKWKGKIKQIVGKAKNVSFNEGMIKYLKQFEIDFDGIYRSLTTFIKQENMPATLKDKRIRSNWLSQKLGARKFKPRERQPEEGNTPDEDAKDNDLYYRRLITHRDNLERMQEQITKLCAQQKYVDVGQKALEFLEQIQKKKCDIIDTKLIKAFEEVFCLLDVDVDFDAKATDLYDDNYIVDDEDEFESAVENHAKTAHNSQFNFESSEEESDYDTDESSDKRAIIKKDKLRQYQVKQIISQVKNTLTERTLLKLPLKTFKSSARRFMDHSFQDFIFPFPGVLNDYLRFVDRKYKTQMDLSDDDEEEKTSSESKFSDELSWSDLSSDANDFVFLNKDEDPYENSWSSMTYTFDPSQMTNEIQAFTTQLSEKYTEDEIDQFLCYMVFMDKILIEGGKLSKLTNENLDEHFLDRFDEARAKLKNQSENKDAVEEKDETKTKQDELIITSKHKFDEDDLKDAMGLNDDGEKKSNLCGYDPNNSQNILRFAADFNFKQRMEQELTARILTGGGMHQFTLKQIKRTEHDGFKEAWINAIDKKLERSSTVSRMLKGWYKDLSVDAKITYWEEFLNSWDNKIVLDLNGVTEQCGYIAIFVAMLLKDGGINARLLTDESPMDLTLKDFKTIKYRMSKFLNIPFGNCFTTKELNMVLQKLDLKGMVTIPMSDRRDANFYHCVYVIDEEEFYNKVFTFSHAYERTPRSIKIAPWHVVDESLNTLTKRITRDLELQAAVQNSSIEEVAAYRMQNNQIDPKIIINLNDRMFYNLPAGLNQVMVIHINENDIDVLAIMYVAEVQVTEEVQPYNLELEIEEFIRRHTLVAVEWQFPTNDYMQTLTYTGHSCQVQTIDGSECVTITFNDRFFKIGNLSKFPFGFQFVNFLINTPTNFCGLDIMRRREMLGVRCNSWLSLAPGVNLIAFDLHVPRITDSYRYPEMVPRRPATFMDLFKRHTWYTSIFTQIASSDFYVIAEYANNFMHMKGFQKDNQTDKVELIMKPGKGQMTLVQDFVRYANALADPNRKYVLTVSVQIFLLLFEIALQTTNSMHLMMQETSHWANIKGKLLNSLMRIFQPDIHTFEQPRQTVDIPLDTCYIPAYYANSYMGLAYTDCDKKFRRDLLELDWSKVNIKSNVNVKEQIEAAKLTIFDMNRRFQTSFKMRLMESDQNLTPKFVLPTELALLHAVYSRQGYPTVYPDKKFIEQCDLLTITKNLLDNLFLAQTILVTEEDYLKHIERKKVKLYTQGFKRFEAEPTISNTYKIMIKNGERSYANEDKKFDLKGRLICNPSPKVKAVIGKYIYWLTLNLIDKHELDNTFHPELNGFIHGDNKERLSLRINKALKNFRNPIFISTDSKRHDAHQSRAILDIDVAVSLQFLPQYCAIHNYTYEQRVAMEKILRSKTAQVYYQKNWTDPTKWKFIFNGGVFSGHPERTTFGNTFRLLVIKEAMKAHSARYTSNGLPIALEHFHAGDDMLDIIEAEDLVPYMKTTKEFFALGDEQMFEKHGVGMRIGELLVGRIGYFCSLSIVMLGREIIDIHSDSVKANLKGSHSLKAGVTITKNDYLKAIDIASKALQHPDDLPLYHYTIAQNLKNQNYRKFNPRKIKEFIKEYNYNFDLNVKMSNETDPLYFEVNRNALLFRFGASVTEVLTHRVKKIQSENPTIGPQMINVRNTLPLAPVKYAEYLGTSIRPKTEYKKNTRKIKRRKKVQKTEFNNINYSNLCDKILDQSELRALKTKRLPKVENRTKKTTQRTKQVRSTQSLTTETCGVNRGRGGKNLSPSERVGRGEAFKKARGITKAIPNPVRKEVVKIANRTIREAIKPMPLANTAYTIGKQTFRNYKKRNQNRRRPLESSSLCRANYLKAIKYPGLLEPLCLPTRGVRASWKTCFRDELNFETGSSGYGFFAIAPCVVTSKNTYYKTASAFAGNTINIATTLPTGVTAHGNTAIITSATHDNTNENSSRVVGVAVTVINRSNVMKAGGVLYLGDSANHDSVDGHDEEQSALAPNVLRRDVAHLKSVSAFFMPLREVHEMQQNSEENFNRAHTTNSNYGVFPWSNAFNMPNGTGSPSIFVFVAGATDTCAFSVQITTYVEYLGPTYRAYMTPSVVNETDLNDICHFYDKHRDMVSRQKG